MSLPELVAFVMWIGLTLYVVFGGADFGAGFWDLVAGRGRRGAKQRVLIEHVIGPVWEANHVWIIFVVVTLWSAFPKAFASIMATLYLPWTAVAIGIILRGSAFAFRKTAVSFESMRSFGAVFASSSVITPFFLGTIAGAVASGRVPVDGPGDVVRSWWNPTSVLAGVLGGATTTFLAAVFWAGGARHRGDDELVEVFRRRGLASAAVAGVCALAGIAVLASDAPALFAGLTTRGWPLIGVSVLGGAGALVSLVGRRLRAARVGAVVAVVAVLWGWAFGQYPWMLEDSLTIADAAGHPATLRAMLIGLGVGAVLFVPPLVALLVLSNRAELEMEGGLDLIFEDDEGLLRE